MSKRPATWLAAIVTAAMLCSCSQSGADFDESAHALEVLEWREWRIAQLKRPEGFLNQIGLVWLEPGRHTFGADRDNDVVIPGAAPARIGVFIVSEDGVTMQVESGVDVRHDGSPVEEIFMADDTHENPVMLSLGSLAWSIVQRVNRYGVRMRDFEHPFVDSFGPLPYYDIDPELRVNSVLRRYPEPRTANVGTVIDGLGYHPESPGIVEFDIAGTRYELEAYTSGERLFYVFGDQTNRDATYGAGRFLYSSTPGEDGRTVLDFNKAYSPPCAFNDFSTCPVASPRNRLPVRIEAGEKYDERLHYSPGN